MGPVTEEPEAPNGATMGGERRLGERRAAADRRRNAAPAPDGVERRTGERRRGERRQGQRRKATDVLEP
jgi:hypothetical protein